MPFNQTRSDSTLAEEIAFGRGLLSDLHFLKPLLSPLAAQFAIIADETVATLYGESLCQQLRSIGLKATLFSFPAGEQSKGRSCKEQIENQLFESGFDRNSAIIALGGGVTTDLAGFVSSTYCRGVPLILAPTTLLAMVDASIGGKNGINLPYGKNLLGTIYPPNKSIIDPTLLNTLPEIEIKNGVVEMIKHGLIADRDYFAFLEENAAAILSLQPEIIDEAIDGSCRIKRKIVKSDEREGGVRRLLNCGHTIGHALESVNNYAIAHGEAVAIGLLAEGYIAQQLGIFPELELQKIETVLRKYRIPLKLPCAIAPERLLEAMSRDKKSSSGQPRFVLIEGIGMPIPFGGEYCSKVPEHIVLNSLNWMCDDLQLD